VNKSELNRIHEQCFEMTLLVTEALSGRLLEWYTIRYCFIWPIIGMIYNKVLEHFW